MKKFFRELVLLMLLLICIGAVSYGNNIFAKNSNNNSVLLSQKYTGKKLDRVLSSIKTKNNYRFLIDSSDSLEAVKDFFIAGDKKAKVKQVGTHTFMVRLPLNSTFLSEELTLIDSGTLPGNIGGYEVIQPEIVEGFGTGYLDGEDTTKLWGQTKILADTFQEELSTKNKIKVGLLDTGIDYTNTDLDNNYNTTLSYDFVNEDTDAMDDNGHGTQVAGIVGAEVNGTGSFGVNSNSDLVALKVLDSNGLGTSYDILEAIDYTKINNIPVLNMSFGGIGDPTTSTVCQAITDAKTNGIYTVVSAGNNNTNITNTIPAGCSDAITVGAIDETNNKASFSNYGTGVTLYAPGVNIYSTSLNNTYSTVNGTSFSAPFVAGLVSKELAMGVGVTYDEVLDNVVNIYGLKYNFELVNTTQNNVVQQQISTGTGWVNTEDLYSRFSDFEYLFNTNDYIYFTDRLNSEVIYKLSNDKQLFGYQIIVGTSRLDNNFSNNGSYNSDYFNSGIFINYSQFIKERNDFYSSIGYIYDKYGDIKYSTQSIGLGKYNIYYKFSNISGIKLNNSMSDNIYIKSNTNEIIYSNINNNNTLYKKSLNNYSDGSQITTNVVSDGRPPVRLSSDGSFLIYKNASNGNKLYKKDLNITGNGTQVTTSVGDYIDISKDSKFFIYRNDSDNYKLYLKNLGDSSNGQAITDVISNNAVITPNNTQIVYMNASDGLKLYKKNIGVSGNGSLFTTSIGIYPKISDDGSFLIYQNGSDGYKLYKKGINETGNGQSTTNSYTAYFDISKLGDYIVYSNGLDGNKLYKKGIYESGNGTKISDTSANKIKINSDINELIYINENDNSSIYKLNLINPQGYAMDDGLYRSPEILPGKNLGYLKININSTIPTGTNYNFYLANQKTEETLFEANESGVDVMGNDIYLFGDNYINGNKQSLLSKVNIGDTIYLDKNGNIGGFKVQYKDDWSIRLEYSPDLWNYTGARVFIGGSNFVKLDNSKLDGNTNLDLNSIFGFTTDKLYYKIELIGDTSDTTKTPVINSVELINGNPIPLPTNLHQLLQSPGQTKQVIIPGKKIGSNEIGTGVILSATVDTNNSGKQFRFIFDITANIDGQLMQTTKYSPYIENGTQEVTVPYVGAGEYSWRVRTEDTSGIYGEPKYYNSPSYIVYNSFDPYPDGYKFKNSEPKAGLYSNQEKWEMLNKVFPNETTAEKWRFFTDSGLNKSKSFTGGNCYGMAKSALMYKVYPEKIQIFEPDFYNEITTGNLWNDLNISIDPDTKEWNDKNIVLKTILEYQLSWHYQNNVDAEIESENTGALNNLNELKKNPDIPYILTFELSETGTTYGAHAVIPYKVEGNKIYIRDNNVPYRENFDRSHETYIEVYSSGGINYPYYEKNTTYKFFKNLAIVNIDIFDLLDSAIGFSDTDMLLTLDGTSDLQIIDNNGNITGFSGGTILENIPGAHIIIPKNITLSGGISENTWKQIYLPQKQDITIKVISKGKETYNLMIAGGDYHTELNGVQTSTGEIDIINSSIDSLKIDFDDNKSGVYNITLDNFQESNTGTVSITGSILVNSQEFDVDRLKVQIDSDDAIIQSVDSDNDGIYDEQTPLPSVYQDITDPTTTASFSGQLTTGYSTSSYIETVNIGLNATDNEGGSGVNKTYYAIGTDTGSLVYVEYTEPVVVNGVGDYTLNYYSTDKFGNQEEIKNINFSLVGKAETYAGNISGYVYDDENNNGIEDSGEKRMAGWKICIDVNNNNDCDEQSEPFNLTNNDGYYEFDSLVTGPYKILEIPHQNWIITNNSGYYNISLSNGQVVTNKNFGNYKEKGGKR